MPSYVVTGAGRGLGYALAKELASNPSNTVIGLVRNRDKALEDLARDDIKNVHILTADITDEPALREAARQAGELLGERGLDVLINNGAYVSDTTALRYLSDFEGNTQGLIADMQRSFDVNVYGVLNTVVAFLPLIQKGSLKKVVAISSGMGDVDFINEAKLANAVPYATSKAALNIVFAKFNAAYADQEILFMALCPGMVETAALTPTVTENDHARVADIGARFQAYAPAGFKASPPAEAAKSILAAVDRSSLSEGFGGSFLSHNGTKRWM